MRSLLCCVLVFSALSSVVRATPQADVPIDVRPTLKWILNWDTHQGYTLLDTLADSTALRLVVSTERRTFRASSAMKDSTTFQILRFPDPSTVSFELDNGMPAEKVESRQILIELDGEQWATIDVRSDGRMNRYGPWDMKSLTGHPLQHAGLLTAQLVVSDHDGNIVYSDPVPLMVKEVRGTEVFGSTSIRSELNHPALDPQK